MDIKELTGKQIKICAKSITCKDENGKTTGVVTGIRKFKDLRPADQMKYFKQLRESGAWGSGLDIMDSVIFDGREVYYLDNLKPYEAYEKYFYGMEAETKRYNERKQIAENMKIFSTVISCYIQ